MSTYCILEENGTISFGDEFSVNLDFNKDPGSYFESFDVNGDKMADLTSHDGNGNIAIVEGHIGTNIFCFIFPQKNKISKILQIGYIQFYQASYFMEFFISNKAISFISKIKFTL